MPAFDYAFDNVPVTLGTNHEFTARGEIEVRYTCYRGDRDMGEFSRDVEWDTVLEMTVTLTDENGDDVMEIITNWQKPMYQEIISEIDDAIYTAALADAFG